MNSLNSYLLQVFQYDYTRFKVREADNGMVNIAAMPNQEETRYRYVDAHHKGHAALTRSGNAKSYSWAQWKIECDDSA